MDVSNTTFSYFVFLKSYITIVLSVCFLQFQIYWSYTYNFFLLSRRYSIENLSELFCKKSVACLRWHNGFEGPLLLDDSRRKFCNISFEKLTCVPDVSFYGTFESFSRLPLKLDSIFISENGPGKENCMVRKTRMLLATVSLIAKEILLKKSTRNGLCTEKLYYLVETYKLFPRKKKAMNIGPTICIYLFFFSVTNTAILSCYPRIVSVVVLTSTFAAVWKMMRKCCEDRSSSTKP